jgi:hypothetical protein
VSDPKETKSLSVDMQNVFYRFNEHYKLVEAVDALSGKVIALQEDYNDEHILNPERMLKLNVNGTEMLVQKGMSVSDYVPPKLAYSKPAADIILQRVAAGQTLTQACKSVNLEPSMVLRWAEKIPSFGEEINRARLIRAELTQDKILDTADELSGGTLTKAELEGKVKAVEILKWSAEKDSPNRFGNKKESGGNTAAIIQIITGVTRDEPVTVEIKNND